LYSHEIFGDGLFLFICIFVCHVIRNHHPILCLWESEAYVNYNFNEKVVLSIYQLIHVTLIIKLNGYRYMVWA
jgi:hypothetical protein